jgi:hypothetical protein
VIALLLSALMALVLLLALLMRRRSPAVALGMAGVAALGLWFAWRPNDLNNLAHAVGVGRGADLALYLGLSLVLLALAGLYLQLRHLQSRFTQLAREMALVQAGAGAPHGLPGAAPASPTAAPASTSTPTA